MAKSPLILVLASCVIGSHALTACGMCIDVVVRRQSVGDIDESMFLCRDRTDSGERTQCYRVLESMFYYAEYAAYWLTYGCESSPGNWVYPCPASMACELMVNLHTKKTFCSPGESHPIAPWDEQPEVKKESKGTSIEESEPIDIAFSEEEF